jgi:hypothetical protein
MQRFGDWNSKARELTAITDREGAPYFIKAQEAIKKHTMNNPFDLGTPTVPGYTTRNANTMEKHITETLSPEELEMYYKYANSHRDRPGDMFEFGYTIGRERAFREAIEMMQVKHTEV